MSIRLSQAEYDLLREAASGFDMPAGAWARERLLAAARRALRG